MDVVFLNEISRDDIDLAGGKGANLGELINRGFPVPPGFVVTTPVYHRFVSELDFSETPVQPGRVRTAIESMSLDESIIEEILQHHRELQVNRDSPITYAVRSSATAEDGGETSFAGQHETYYYVDESQLMTMIRRCWSSLWSDAAFSYRESQGIDHREVLMAVVVQEMVQADTAGVTFTADPLSGDTNRIVTDASWGMGAAIVDGRVSPDQYVVDKATGKMISRRVSDKRFMVPGNVSPSDSARLVPVPAEKRRSECLTAGQLEIIHDWARRSESHFGTPQDMEWAFRDDEFFVLQTRPITALGSKEPEIPEGKFVIFKPMYENFSGPVLPLSRDIFGSQFPILTFIYGRTYLNLAHIRPLFPFRISDEQIAKFAYLSGDDDFKPVISWWRLARFGLFLFAAYLLFGVLYRRVRGLPDDFMESYREKVDGILGDPDVDAPGTLERLFLRVRFFEPLGNLVLMVNISAGRYFLLMAVIGRLLKRWLPDMDSDTPSQLCSGGEGILSTDMGRRIWRLARTAKQHDGLREIIVRRSPPEALAALRDLPEAEEFMEDLAGFLRIHGHRALREFELDSVRWEEDPSPIIAMVRNYLLAESDPDRVEDQAREYRVRLEGQIRTALENLPLEKPLRPRWRLIDLLRERARYFIKLRENSRFYHIMAFYAVRKKVLEVERELLARGKLKCRDDIFFLKWHEIRCLQDDRLGWQDVENTIRRRRIDHIRLGKLVPPRTLGIEISTPPETATGNVIQGRGASPGTCRGVARVIMDPGIDAEIKPGEILVAPFTDPAWTPLFLTASAAVVEIGSFLSHAGTIAREYGMPCVVDVADCTTRIRTGDTIEVDGGTGTVVLMDGASNGAVPGD